MLGDTKRQSSARLWLVHDDWEKSHDCNPTKQQQNLQKGVPVATGDMVMDIQSFNMWSMRNFTHGRLKKKWWKWTLPRVGLLQQIRYHIDQGDVDKATWAEGQDPGSGILYKDTNEQNQHLNNMFDKDLILLSTLIHISSSEWHDQMFILWGNPNKDNDLFIKHQ